MPSPGGAIPIADREARTSKRLALVGVSPVRYAEATTNVMARAREPLRGGGWLQVTDRGGLLEHGTRA
jgi:flavin-binding protein dodecin